MAGRYDSDGERFPQSKVCTRCGEDRPLEHYTPGDGRLGRIAKCRPCMRQIGAEHRRARPDKAKEYRDRYRAKHPDRVAESTAKHRAENMDRIRARGRQWRLDNPEKCREGSKRRRTERPEEYSRRAIEWRRVNPDKARATQRRWKEARKGDVGYRLTNAVRSSMCRAVVRGFKKDRARTFDLLGYSLGDLKAHLEALFQPGMSWENYGDWHIDHIIPIAALKYEAADDPNFRRAWALANLRPLWAIENRRKHAKLPPEVDL